MSDTVASASPDADHAHASNGSAVVQIRISDKAKALIVSCLIAANLIATVMMFIEWKIAERESRLLEYYVMELDGKLMAAGIIQHPDSWSGRKGERK